MLYQNTYLVNIMGDREMNKRKLNLPKNFKHIIPRCCLTCKSRVSVKTFPDREWDDHMSMVCERDGINREDEPEFHICDYYKY